MNVQIRKSKGTNFLGIGFTTAAELISVMSYIQCDAYNCEYGLKVTIKPSTLKVLLVIAGHGKVKVETVIQIPFQDLGMIIDVGLMIIE